jgi:hypothetical protein
MNGSSRSGGPTQSGLVSGILHGPNMLNGGTTRDFILEIKASIARSRKHQGP